jgi:hypothetical protein
MDWDLWTERIRQVPAASVDQAGPLPTILEPDEPVLTWNNFLVNPEMPTLQVLAAPASTGVRLVHATRWPVLVACVGFLVICGRRVLRGGPRARSALAASLALVVCAGWFWLARGAELSDDRARDLVSGLLHNVYRAFDFRDEGRIYDVLAASVEGDLLERIYLETRRGLELASQGGARAKVKEVELVDLAVTPGEDGFLATASWNVAGAVGHWGHMHQRRNRYRAELEVAPVDGVWKLRALTVLEEERL